MKTFPALCAIACAPLLLACTALADAATLSPFEARYEAYYEGRPAGNATMRLVDGGAATGDGTRWRMDLDIQGDRGLVGLVRLNIDQSTVFEARGDAYVPLSQSTVRKALVFGRTATGTYDWAARTARWSGDIDRDRQAPVALQDGDLSGLLINLAIMRDAAPGRTMEYRFVDGGRVRQHAYAVAPATENVAVGDMNYEALRVSRTNGGNDEMIVWVACGVPTPVRILQRENGSDAVDLRLIEYQGAP